MNNRLFISCCGNKLDHAAPAIDLYQARQFKLAQQLLQQGWEVTIISAKYGLVDAAQVIDTYEQKMTPKRSDEILCRAFREDISDTNNYVFGGELYRRIIRKMDPSVHELVGANRGNADHYSAFAALTGEQA